VRSPRPVATKYDWVVTPYTTQFLDGPNVHNILLQDVCPTDTVSHIGLFDDGPTMQLVLNALGPDDPHFQPDCRVAGHPWVIGELALGRLSGRGELLALLANLPQATVASEAEVAALIETRKLYGHGIGYVDAQLLAATLLSCDHRPWTRDRHLAATAAELGCAAELRPA